VCLQKDIRRTVREISDILGSLHEQAQSKRACNIFNSAVLCILLGFLFSLF
jgi:hypothetical protein